MLHSYSSKCRFHPTTCQQTHGHLTLVQAIDMMHASRSVVLMMDDTKYKVAQLLNKPGDKATYTYDLGDKYDQQPPAAADTLCCHMLHG